MEATQFRSAGQGRPAVGAAELLRIHVAAARELRDLLRREADALVEVGRDRRQFHFIAQSLGEGQQGPFRVVTGPVEASVDHSLHAASDRGEQGGHDEGRRREAGGHGEIDAGKTGDQSSRPPGREESERWHGENQLLSHSRQHQRGIDE